MNEGRKWKRPEFIHMQNRQAAWRAENPGASPSEDLLTLQRLYEQHNYGVTSRDLTLGRSIDYVEEDGNYYRVESQVRGYFQGNPNRLGDLPECHFVRTRWKVENGKKMSYNEYVIDSQIQKSLRDEEIKLAAGVPDPHTTSEQTGVTSKSLMHTAVESGFGSTDGVITPVFMNMLLELVSHKAFFKNFINVQPMPTMSFYFPMCHSRVQDVTIDGTIEAFDQDALPTPEGRAGEDFEIDWGKWEVNGWKYLRHFELSNEIGEMIGQYIGVGQKYLEYIAEGMSLLWDWPIFLGIQTMLTRGVWRYPRLSSGTYTWYTTGTKSIAIPWGSASVLTTNAKKNYLFQDLATGAGKIYEPSVTTTEEFVYQLSTARDYSATTDTLIEGIMALASLMDEKHSQLQYIILTDSVQKENLFRDADMRNLTIRSGEAKFQSEDGYLGQIAIGGSSSFVDLWIAPHGFVPSVTGDTTATTYTTGTTLYPIFGGKYGGGWNQGVFTPFNLRVDDGMESRTDGDSVNRLRPTETKVTTASQKGSSWPANYNDVVILWESRTAHP